MHFSLSLVFLALCLIAWECTADGGNTDGQQLQSGAGGTSETTAPKTDSKDTGDQQVVLQRDVQTDVIVDDDASEEEDDAKDEEDSLSGSQGKTQGGANLPQDEVPKTTTTTTTNKGPLGAVQITPEGNGRSSTSQVQSTVHTPNREEKPAASGQKTDGTDSKEEGDVKTTKTTTASSPVPGVQNGVSFPTGGKTTTTSPAVHTSSGSQEDIVKEQSTPPKDGDAPDPKVKDAAAAATTTTTNAPGNTLPKQFNIPQSVNNKDSGSINSLLLAFAIFATLAVIPVAAV